MIKIDNELLFTSTPAHTNLTACASKSVVPESKSRSHLSLPEWIKLVYYTQIYPTLIEFYGSLPNPFILENNAHIIIQIQKIINKALPVSQYASSNVRKDDKLYIVVHNCLHCFCFGFLLCAQAYQDVIDWQQKFLSNAIAIVSCAVCSCGSQDLECAKFAQDAVAVLKSAFYEFPGLRQEVNLFSD
jgi:hypothetical protein